MVAARVRGIYDKQAKDRMKAGGGDKKSGMENLPHPIGGASTARDAAGKAVGVSGKSVDYATRVLERGGSTSNPRDLTARSDRHTRISK